MGNDSENASFSKQLEKQMNKYNQNILKLMKDKDYLPCTVCNENKR